MLTKRRLVAAASALACAVALVTVVSPGGVGNAATPPRPGSMSRASVPDGGPATGDAAGKQSPHGGGNSSISGDGRYDVFVSDSNLDPNSPGTGTHDEPCGCPTGPTNVPNTGVYVRDLKTGRTDLISIAENSQAHTVEPAFENSDYPSISADGRYVSFWTTSPNIVTNSDGEAVIVVCDRGAPNAQGVYPSLAPPVTPTGPQPYPPTFHCIRAADSVNLPGLDSDSTNLSDGWPHLDAAGDRIVWADVHFDAATESQSDEVVTETLPHNLTDGTFLVPGNPVTIGIHSAAVPGFGRDPAEGDGPDVVSAYEPQISADGNWLVAAAVGENSDVQGILEADLRTAEPTVRRVDADPSTTKADPAFVGSSDEIVGHPAVSEHGTRVVFDAGNFGIDDPENYPDVYAATVNTSVKVFGGDDSRPATSSVLVSVVANGKTATPDLVPGDGAYPTISADGRYVAFVTDRDGMYAAPSQAAALGNSSCLFQESAEFDGNSNFRAASSAAPSSAPSASRSPSQPAEGVKGVAAGVGPLKAPPPPTGTEDDGPSRTFCQVVARDLNTDAAATAAGKPLPAAHLASPSTSLDCFGEGPKVVGATCPGNEGDSENPVSLSSNGGQVGFDSLADDLVANDTNATEDFSGVDAFVWTWTPTLTVAPVKFGTVQVGTSSQRAVSVTVTGFGPIEVGKITITGADPGDFTITMNTCTPVPAAVNADAPCTLVITFTPGATGPRTGTINIPVVDPTRPTTTVTVPVTGNGTTNPVITKNPQVSADPAVVDFGSNLPRAPGKTKTITITNFGGATLHVTSVAVADNTHPGTHIDYTVNDTGCLAGVPKGGTCTITVTFVGHAVGRRDAVLVITDDTPSGMTIIGLVANVPKPVVEANPGVSPPGRVTSVSGTGFAPNRQVDVQIEATGETATGRADAHGAFSAPLVLYTNMAQGPQVVRAHSHGVSPTISAEGPLLVVLGSVDSSTTTLSTRH